MTFSSFGLPSGALMGGVVPAASNIQSGPDLEEIHTEVRVHKTSLRLLLILTLFASLLAFWPSLGRPRSSFYQHHGQLTIYPLLPLP